MRAYSRYKVMPIEGIWQVRGFPGDDVDGDLTCRDCSHYHGGRNCEGFVV